LEERQAITRKRSSQNIAYRHAAERLDLWSEQD